MKYFKNILFLVLIISIIFPAHAIEIERRKEQFDKEYGHLFLPLPINIPGLGTGVLFISNIGNIANTSTDFTAIYGVGDFTVAFGILDELFLYPDLIYLRYNKAHAYDFAIQQYRLRGMNTDKNDFSYGVGKYWDYNNPELKLTFDDRFLEFGVGKIKQLGKFDKFVAPNKDDPSKLGETLVEFTPAFEQVLSDQIQFTATIDYTDDFRDPRKGIRHFLFIDRQASNSSSEPAYDTVTNETQIYIPALEKSTLVFDFLFSDAYVNNEGETNLETLKTESNYYLCDYTSNPDDCRTTTLSNAINVRNFNKNGNSVPLGGSDRLRSYPQGRFGGAHTLYFASEFRWNFSSIEDEISLYVIEDVIDELQAAFFFEYGSISETKDELGNYSKYSVGAGFRLLNKSGNLYRIDFATGDEGPQFTAIFQYPWYFQL